jgi:hypothetical protein
MFQSRIRRSAGARSHHLRSAATALIALTVAAACDAPATLAPDHAEPDAQVLAADATPQASRAVNAEIAGDELIEAIRHATARYNSTEQAVRDGFQPENVCVPQMGYHWVNFGRVDPVFDPLAPEIMVYAPGPNGQPQLVAVEYLVVDIGQGRPELNGYPMDDGVAPLPFDHWTLHVWLYEDNPDGIFEAHNPNVNCGN